MTKIQFTPQTNRLVKAHADMSDEEKIELEIAADLLLSCGRNCHTIDDILLVSRALCEAIIHFRDGRTCGAGVYPSKGVVAYACSAVFRIQGIDWELALNNRGIITEGSAALSERLKSLSGDFVLSAEI